MKYSSTVLKLFEDNCPAALGFFEQGAPQFTEVFQAGIAAHAVLQTVGEKKATTPDAQRKVADAVVQELITHGRAYRGTPEPPMNSESAFEGRDIALNWLEFNELPDNATYENEFSGESLGLDYVGLIDRAYTQTSGDEDYAVEAFVVSDYKTSWQARANELDTLQRRGQAVLARANMPESCNAIIQEVVNIRLGATYRREIMLDDEGEALLKQWKNDIETMVNAAKTTRTPRPGLNCIGCPYFLGCEHGKALINQVEDRVAQYAGAKAMVQSLEKILKKEAANQPVSDANGKELGFSPAERRQPNDDVIEQLCTVWYPDGKATDGARGLMYALKPGVTQIENVAKALYSGRDGKEARDELVELCTDKIIVPTFGVLK